MKSVELRLVGRLKAYELELDSGMRQDLATVQEQLALLTLPEKKKTATRRKKSEPPRRPKKTTLAAAFLSASDPKEDLSNCFYH